MFLQGLNGTYSGVQVSWTSIELPTSLPQCIATRFGTQRYVVSLGHGDFDGSSGLAGPAPVWAFQACLQSLVTLPHPNAPDNLGSYENIFWPETVNDTQLPGGLPIDNSIYSAQWASDFNITLCSPAPSVEQRLSSSVSNISVGARCAGFGAVGLPLSSLFSIEFNSNSTLQELILELQCPSCARSMQVVLLDGSIVTADGLVGTVGGLANENSTVFGSATSPFVPQQFPYPLVVGGANQPIDSNYHRTFPPYFLCSSFWADLDVPQTVAYLAPTPTSNGNWSIEMLGYTLAGEYGVCAGSIRWSPSLQLPSGDLIPASLAAYAGTYSFTLSTALANQTATVDTVTVTNEDCNHQGMSSIDIVPSVQSPLVSVAGENGTRGVFTACFVPTAPVLSQVSLSFDAAPRSVGAAVNETDVAGARLVCLNCPPLNRSLLFANPVSWAVSFSDPLVSWNTGAVCRGFDPCHYRRCVYNGTESIRFPVSMLTPFGTADTVPPPNSTIYTDSAFASAAAYTACFRSLSLFLAAPCTEYPPTLNFTTVAFRNDLSTITQRNTSFAISINCSTCNATASAPSATPTPTPSPSPSASATATAHAGSSSCSSTQTPCLCAVAPSCSATPAAPPAGSASCTATRISSPHGSRPACSPLPQRNDQHDSLVVIVVLRGVTLSSISGNLALSIDLSACTLLASLRQFFQWACACMRNDPQAASQAAAQVAVNPPILVLSAWDAASNQGWAADVLALSNILLASPVLQQCVFHGLFSQRRLQGTASATQGTARNLAGPTDGTAIAVQIQFDSPQQLEDARAAFASPAVEEAFAAALLDSLVTRGFVTAADSANGAVRVELSGALAGPSSQGAASPSVSVSPGAGGRTGGGVGSSSSGASLSGGAVAAIAVAAAVAGLVGLGGVAAALWRRRQPPQATPANRARTAASTGLPHPARDPSGATAAPSHRDTASGMSIAQPAAIVAAAPVTSP